MIRLSAYLVLLVVIAVLVRDAATWAWVAYNAPIASAGSTPPASVSASETNSDAAATTIAELDQRPLTAFPQTSSRPLFFEGRRYPSREVPKVAARAPEATTPTVNVKELKLLGIRIGEGASRALIAVGTQPPNWVNVGEIIMAWTVKSVDSNDVLLEREGQTAALKLYGS